MGHCLKFPLCISALEIQSREQRSAFAFVPVVSLTFCLGFSLGERESRDRIVVFPLSTPEEPPVQPFVHLLKKVSDLREGRGF